MNKRWRPLLILTLLALVLALGYYGYKKLKDRAVPDVSDPAATEEVRKTSEEEKTTNAEVPSEEKTSETEVTTEEKTSADVTTTEAAPGTEEDNGQPAPDFTVYDNDGNAVRLSQMKGKPVIVNFWATWCPPCRAELPGFNEASEKYKDEITFMMVDLTDGQSETKDDVAAFLKETGYTFPVYYDTEGSGALAYGVYSIPLTIFINENGNIENGHLGSMDEKTLNQYIDSLLN